MAKKTVLTEAEPSASEYVLSATQVRYLLKLAALKKEHERASGISQKHIFAKMIHLFMQEICGYPDGSYMVTTSAYGDGGCGAYPHVVPASFYANSTLFYFTVGEDTADIQELWVRHGQIYVDEPRKGDPVRDCATQIVISNFITIDGAKKNIRTGSWELWSASEIKGSRSPRIRLDELAEDKQLDAVVSKVFRSRLESIGYRAGPDTKKSDRQGHERLAELMRKANHEMVSFSSKEKRGEGPLNLPIYGLERIEESEKGRHSAALLQTETFDFRKGTNGLISSRVSYKTTPDFDRNLLVCGDNREVMQRLIDAHGSFIDLVYIDPPFCSNRNYDWLGGDSKDGFEDRWSNGLRSYIPWLNERLILIHQLLVPGGNLYLHLDWRAVHYMKVELDKIFGNQMMNEIVWSYTGNQKSKDAFSRKHDTILRYCKAGAPPAFIPQFEPYSEGTIRRYNHVDEDGRRYKMNMYGGKMTKSYMKEEGKSAPDVWTMPFVIPTSIEKTGYPTQKPEELLSRIILASTKENGVVADFFVGSGTTVSVAQKLGRRWIGVDQNPQAIQVACDRIRSVALQKEKAVGITMPNFASATKTGFRLLVGTRYQREDVRHLDDKSNGRALSEFQNFILDCYLPKDGKKGDAQLPGFKVENGREIVVFVGPNRQEIKQHHVVDYVASVSRRAPKAAKIEILGWSFAPSLLKQLDRLVSEHGKEIELKKIHVSPVEIEKALAERNVKFIPAARATMAEAARNGSQLVCSVKLVSPASEVRDVHWFIYPHPTEDLQRIEYNFVRDEVESDVIELEPDEDDDEVDSKEILKQQKSLESKLCHTFKGIKNGEYRVYVRITDRHGRPTALIENLKVSDSRAERIDELTAERSPVEKNTDSSEAA